MSETKDFLNCSTKTTFFVNVFFLTLVMSIFLPLWTPRVWDASNDIRRILTYCSLHGLSATQLWATRSQEHDASHHVSLGKWCAESTWGKFVRWKEFYHLVQVFKELSITALSIHPVGNYSFPPRNCELHFRWKAFKTGLAGKSTSCH